MNDKQQREQEWEWLELIKTQALARFHNDHADGDIAISYVIGAIKAKLAALEARHLAEVAILRSDLAAAMGHMKGCGHEYPYLLKRYPELNNITTRGEKTDA